MTQKIFAPTDAAAAARRIANTLPHTARQQLDLLCRLQRDGINLVWHNPDGLTPQQVCDAAGTNAGILFAAHGIITEAIYRVAALGGNNAPDILLPTNAWTVHEDGTITVLDAPYAPQG